MLSMLELASCSSFCRSDKSSSMSCVASFSGLFPPRSPAGDCFVLRPWLGAPPCSQGPLSRARFVPSSGRAPPESEHCLLGPRLHVPRLLSCVKAPLPAALARASHVHVQTLPGGRLTLRPWTGRPTGVAPGEIDPPVPFARGFGEGNPPGGRIRPAPVWSLPKLSLRVTRGRCSGSFSASLSLCTSVSHSTPLLPLVSVSVHLVHP